MRGKQSACHFDPESGWCMDRAFSAATTAAIEAFASDLGKDVRIPIVDPPANSKDAYRIAELTFLLIPKRREIEKRSNSSWSSQLVLGKIRHRLCSLFSSWERFESLAPTPTLFSHRQRVQFNSTSLRSLQSA
jgi:hypothetical protein